MFQLFPGVVPAAACSSASATGWVLVPSPPPSAERRTAWDRLPHKNIFDSLFLNSFYVVNGIVFTTFLFFFFRSHNFKKPYITSFNRKKALIEKEDTRNMAILTLLPKIDILRLTKRHHRKELCSL